MASIDLDSMSRYLRLTRYGEVVTSEWPHLWSIFTLHWPVVAWCALVGRE